MISMTSLCALWSSGLSQGSLSAHIWRKHHRSWCTSRSNVCLRFYYVPTPNLNSSQSVFLKRDYKYEVWVCPWASTVANSGENPIVPESHLSLTTLMNRGPAANFFGRISAWFSPHFSSFRLCLRLLVENI